MQQAALLKEPNLGCMVAPRLGDTLNHRITESLRLEKTSQIPKSNPNPSHHVPKCHISVVVRQLQGWILPR